MQPRAGRRLPRPGRGRRQVDLVGMEAGERREPAPVGVDRGVEAFAARFQARGRRRRRGNRAAAGRRRGGGGPSAARGACEAGRAAARRPRQLARARRLPLAPRQRFVPRPCERPRCGAVREVLPAAAAPAAGPARLALGETLDPLLSLRSASRDPPAVLERVAVADLRVAEAFQHRGQGRVARFRRQRLASVPFAAGPPPAASPIGPC